MTYEAKEVEFFFLLTLADRIVQLHSFNITMLVKCERWRF